jgi:hypothetical protein
METLYEKEFRIEHFDEVFLVTVINIETMKNLGVILGKFKLA